MTLYFTISSPHQWVSLDNKGVHDSGAVDSLSELKINGQRCVAVVPGEQVNSRLIEIPVRNRQKLLAAIPFAIEDSLISRVDELHFTILNVSADNQVAFAYVSREQMADWVNQVQEAGISLSAVIPDYLLLHQDAKEDAVVSLSERGEVLVRSGLYTGAVTSRQNFPAWLDELENDTPIYADPEAIEQLPALQTKNIIAVETGQRLVDWLTQGLPDHDAVLLSGEFEQGGQRSVFKRYWPAVAMIVLAGLIKFGSDVAEMIWLQKTQAQVENNIQALYQDLFPDSKLVPGRARIQTRNNLMKLQSAGGDNGFIYLLVTTSTLLKDKHVIFEELDYRNGNLIAVLTLNDFAHLDDIKLELQKDPSISVNLKQSGAQGDKVQVRFEISMAAVT